MSDKYIIRNCPATGPGCCGYICPEITDCPLKQIVENLRQVAYAGHCDSCDGCGYYNGCGDTECGTYQALKSLELLDIQEVE